MQTKMSLVHTSTILASVRRSAWLPWLTKKINLPTNRGTPEGPETLVQEYLTWEFDYFGFKIVGTLFSHVLKNKKQKNDYTKLNPKYLDFPCRELSNGSLGNCCSPHGHFGNCFLRVCLYWGSNSAVNWDITSSLNSMNVTYIKS